MAGTQLKSAIKDAGLTQEVVADHLGVTQSAVSLWVLGKSRPEVERVAELADLIHADAVELVLAWWPELKQTDRLAGIRARLAGAADADIAEVESWLDSRKTPASAPVRRRRAR